MASSSSSVPDWKYEVFLNFRGEDIRRTFISHLHRALVRNSINTFIDAEELRKGNCLSQLLTAISDSRLSVVVFSQNYASSTWCLRELVQILQCMDQKKQIVIPIFYQVDPSHVRKIKGSFEEAFSKHERDPNADVEEVQRWRTAFQRAPDLCGWDSQNYQDDAKLIESIVDDIFKKLFDILPSEKNGLVGMDSRLQKMDSLLCPEVADVRCVGIWGMGGIGKTTIARAMYHKINHHFEGRCFVENVKRRFPSTDAGEEPLDLQAEILSSITNMKVGRSEILRNGFQKMMERVGKKKVLLVLDNVESSSQIEALIGKQPSFGGGSRIIITTRYKQSLSRLVDHIYEPEVLNDEDALELFMQYAFSTKQPTEEYIDLSGHFTKYARGLPLALKVLGAFLNNKSVRAWKDELNKIEGNPPPEIQTILRTSFDGLDRLQKEIFLDIACFFKQMKKDSVTRIMEGCDFYPHSGLDVLLGRALVTISSDGVLEMHDLLEEMGREIVREKSIEEPGRRSRLWSYEDVRHVLTKKKATEAVESIIVHWPLSDNVVELDTAFVKMTKLRLLRVHTHSLEQLRMPNNQWQYEDLRFISEKLSYLFWHKCPLKSLSSNFNPENLVEIDMQQSWVEHLWKGTMPLGKLKIINLKGSHRLKETPDFTEAKNLEKLILGGCTSLYEVHPSISALEKLVLLDLSWCGKLSTFSSNICMKSLETLDLSFCSRLEKFPEISKVMEKLSKLYLQGTAIKELPRSINNLTGLVTLNLEYCRELEILPSSIVQLKSLQFLNLSGCPKLKCFPGNVGNMEGLRELRLDETSVEDLCPSISSLENLESLSLKQCKKLHSFPRSSIYMRSLRTLNLSGCSNVDKFSEIPEVMNLSDLNLDETAISELPSSIKNFTRLVTLSLKDCRRLKILPGNIHMRSLQALDVSGCSNLKNFPEFLEVTENLTELHLDWTLFSSTFKNLTEHEHEQASRHRKIVKLSGIAMEEFPSIIYRLTGLATLTLRYSNDYKSLPRNICQLKSLKYLSLSGCTNFKVFPDILENMERLASLDLDSTSIRVLPASIERLQGLVSLNLNNCKSLVYLPDSICNLLRLEWLTLHGCSKLSKLHEDLLFLKGLDVEETGIRGYLPEQRFITLGDLAQFRSTAALMIKAMVPNIEQNEADLDQFRSIAPKMADVESYVEERQDIAKSSYVEEASRSLEEKQRLEERLEMQQLEERSEELRLEIRRLEERSEGLLKERREERWEGLLLKERREECLGGEKRKSWVWRAFGRAFGRNAARRGRAGFGERLEEMRRQEERLEEMGREEEELGEEMRRQEERSEEMRREEEELGLESVWKRRGEERLEERQDIAKSSYVEEVRRSLEETQRLEEHLEMQQLKERLVELRLEMQRLVERLEELRLKERREKRWEEMRQLKERRKKCLEEMRQQEKHLEEMRREEEELGLESVWKKCGEKMKSWVWRAFGFGERLEEMRRQEERLEEMRREEEELGLGLGREEEEEELGLGREEEEEELGLGREEEELGLGLESVCEMRREEEELGLENVWKECGEKRKSWVWRTFGRNAGLENVWIECGEKRKSWVWRAFGRNAARRRLEELRRHVRRQEAGLEEIRREEEELGEEMRRREEEHLEEMRRREEELGLESVWKRRGEERLEERWNLEETQQDPATSTSF